MKRHALFGLIFLIGSHIAVAQDVRRCVRADGSVLFTDGRCGEGDSELQQAIPRQPSASATGQYPGIHRVISLPPGCSRTADDLLYGIRTAIEMRDTNQLAKYYHWPDVSSEQAERIMDQLEKLVNSPLMDIQLVFPVEAEQPLPAMEEPPTDALEDFEEPYEYVEPTPRRRSPPYAVKLLQLQSDTSNQSRSTVLRLQRHFDCWWVRY
jgi:hypothetical protein